MSTSTSDSSGNHGSRPSFDTGDKIKRQIREAGQSISDSDNSIANKVESVLGQAKQKVGSVTDAVQRTRESVSESSEALITYTKENPVKALMIAAASGASLWALLKAINSSDE